MLVHLVAVGALVGLLGAVGWRHGTRRRILLDNPPPMRPGDTGFMFTFDYLQHVAGPRWWPELLVLPAIGATVAVVVGLFYWRLRPINRQSAEWLAVALPAGVAGAAVAATAVLLTYTDQPAVLVRSEQGSSSAPLTTDLIAGGPWSYELAPVPVWFPAIGIASAVMLSIAMYSAHRAVRRYRRTPDRPDHHGS